MKLCSLCGEPILDDPADPGDAESAEHAVPKQFFITKVRRPPREKLWTVPSHQRCNQSYRMDEEYFYTYVYPLVDAHNKGMGKELLADIRRRTRKPQPQALLRRLLRDTSHVTPGGILLPPSVVWVKVEKPRIYRVVTKIAKCLYYKDRGKPMPKCSSSYVKLCESPEELEEPFDDLRKCEEVERRSAAPDIFRYWYVDDGGVNWYAMLFWEAFMVCMIFKEPD